MENEKILDRINSLFKEELWGRIEPKDIGISKFKILDSLVNSIISENLYETSCEVCRKHLKEHPESITASYLTGILGYHYNRVEDTVNLRKLIDLFVENHKWAVVERISEKILEYGENRIALKSLAISLERLGRNKEAIPVWENLLKIDRFDTEVAKKLAYAIIDDDPEKSIQYMKLSIEGFIKNGDFQEIGPLWNKLVSISWDDISFFERIERMLIEAKEYDLTSNLLKSLLNKYRDEENPDQSIDLLTKILDYTPEDNNARKELIKFYEKKYGSHSQYQQFIKISKLNNFKYPVKHAIQNFEKNIIFDKDNYAYHRSWGVGRITDINSEFIIVDFQDKPDHKMSIQMALQSLAPLNKNHIHVMEYEDFNALKALFAEDFMQFFEILIKSYDGSITLTDIKKELIPKYIDAKAWTKWWGRTRSAIKQDPHFAFSDKQKDLIFMRDKPVTFGEELLDHFSRAQSFSERLNYAIEFINNIDKSEGEPIAPYFIDYFSGTTKDISATKQILSYFILRSLTAYVDPKKLKLDTIRDKVISFIKESQELPLISLKISSYDYKKDFINLIREAREDWPQVVSEILFETPVRIHKYIINNLISAHAYNAINGFIDRTITGAKQYPEIFLWVARNILTWTWNYEWLDFSREGFILTYFRLLNELKKIETKGNRLKNIALETLFDDDAQVLGEIVQQNSPTLLGKLYDIFRNVSYVEESQTDKFLNLIRSRYADFSVSAQSKDSEEWVIDVEKLIVSMEGREKMDTELARMINVEMVHLTQELKKAADVSGDVRENVEYNSLMEKQTILEMSINKLKDEIKKAEVLDLEKVSADSVNIGTTVTFEDLGTGESINYTILGPWDADFERKILSYRSPIAKALLGKKPAEEFTLKFGEEEKKYKIQNIEKYRL